MICEVNVEVSLFTVVVKNLLVDVSVEANLDKEDELTPLAELANDFKALLAALVNEDISAVVCLAADNADWTGIPLLDSNLDNED